MGRARKAPPEEPLPNRLAEHIHNEPEVPTGAIGRLMETDDEVIARMNRESAQRMAAEEAPIIEGHGGSVADHPAYLPGMTPVHYPELDKLVLARHQAMQARQAASQSEKDANAALLEKMDALQLSVYTSPDGLKAMKISGKVKVKTEHDSGQKTGINNDPDDPSLDELDEEENVA